jgi:hypothetical protein
VCPLSVCLWHVVVTRAFNKILESDPDLAVAVAAITILTEVIKVSKGTLISPLAWWYTCVSARVCVFTKACNVATAHTMYEVQLELKEAAYQLQLCRYERESVFIFHTHTSSSLASTMRVRVLCCALAFTARQSPSPLAARCSPTSSRALWRTSTYVGLRPSLASRYSALSRAHLQDVSLHSTVRRTLRNVRHD